MKQLLVAILLLFWTVLAGCSHGGNRQTVTFNQFQMRIDSAFQEAPTWLVENKQILNKVVKSFKKKSELGFATNLVVTRSQLPTELDYEQFRTANSSKVRSFLVGYEQGNERNISFTCNGQTIEGIYVTFSAKNTFVGNGGPYYFAQYQFVHESMWYIISYATANPEEQNALRANIDTLSC